MGLIDLISNAFGAVQEFFGFARQRDAEKNAPDVQAAASAQKELDAEDKTKKAITKEDLDEERRQLSE